MPSGCSPQAQHTQEKSRHRPTEASPSLPPTVAVSRTGEVRDSDQHGCGGGLAPWGFRGQNKDITPVRTTTSKPKYAFLKQLEQTFHFTSERKAHQNRREPFPSGRLTHVQRPRSHPAGQAPQPPRRPGSAAQRRASGCPQPRVPAGTRGWVRPRSLGEPCW